MQTNNEGFNKLLEYPFWSALFHRRSRRISKGLASVPAGSLTYPPSARPPIHPQPLTELEEAVLIAATGATGLTMPDRPFKTPEGNDMLGSPNLNMPGRSAGSPDNAQATHFFLINDTGTYFLKKLPPLTPGVAVTPEVLITRAASCKQKVLDKRLDFPREFPYYLDSNRFLSNLPGSTVFVPIVDTTQQYINGLLYLLTEPDGHRPCFVDDRHFYLKAGVSKWVRSGFLNEEIKLPLTSLGTFRSDIEADLLLQNLMLTLQAMGLGGWIHASISPQFLISHPLYTKPGEGLGFKWAIPGFKLLDILRWGTFLPKVRANPVGLPDIIKGMCPPYYPDMSSAVDALMEMKYGPNGTYTDRVYFGKIFKGKFGSEYMEEVPRYVPDAIDCCKDVCNYIYETHGRFPAHCNAMHVPGVWLQAHHLDLDYYDFLFIDGYTETQRTHECLWHPQIGLSPGAGGSHAA